MLRNIKYAIPLWALLFGLLLSAPAFVPGFSVSAHNCSPSAPNTQLVGGGTGVLGEGNAYCDRYQYRFNSLDVRRNVANWPDATIAHNENNGWNTSFPMSAVGSCTAGQNDYWVEVITVADQNGNDIHQARGARTPHSC